MDRLKQCCESQNPKPSHLQEFSLSYPRRKGLNNLSIYLSTNPPLSLSSFFIPPFPLSSVPFFLSLSTSHFPLFLSLLFFPSFPIAFIFFHLSLSFLPFYFPLSRSLTLLLPFSVHPFFPSLSLFISSSFYLPLLFISVTPCLYLLICSIVSLIITISLLSIFFYHILFYHYLHPYIHSIIHIFHTEP